MSKAPEKFQVKIARGNLYIPRETYDRYLKNTEAAALLAHENGILLFPLIGQSAGGLLIKIKNLKGDRIIHAQEFFRQNNYAETFEETVCDVVWERDRAALLISGSDLNL